MKQIKTLLALLLCLCMLPLNALAYTVEPGGTHEAVKYTPAENGLYAVTVEKDGKALDPLPAKAAIYDPALTVSVKAGDAAAQEVDYNVFYLEKGTQYTVQLQNISGDAYDDAGEWDVKVAKVELKALALNADTLLEGEWFSFTPEADGSYTFTASPAPVFVELMTEGASPAVAAWATYALDKEVCRVGMELDYLRSLKAAIAGRQETLAQAEQTYQKALDKLDNYNTLIDLADKTGIGSEGSNLFGKKQAVYDALKEALKRGDGSFSFTIPLIGDLFPSLNLPTIDPAIIDEMPEKVTDFPNWLSGRLQSQEGLVGEAKAKYEEQQAQQAEDQARYDAGVAANPQLEPLLMDTSSETVSLRQKVQEDADAIMGGATVLAAGDRGMQLVAAQWQNDENGSLTVELQKDTTYILHALSNLATSATVTDGTQTPDDPDDPVTVDKAKLDKAIKDAKKVDADKYTEESVAAMNEALTAAEAVQSDPDATQAEVDAATKALNDAVNALVEKEVTPPTPTVDKTALQKAIADAKALDTAPYTDESVAAMNEALSDAEAVQANPDATQAEVDAAAKALNDAVNALEEKPADTVDKTALQAAIARAEALDSGKYTEESYAAVTTALVAARLVNLNFFANQERVDEVTKALNDAIDALVEKEVTPPTPTVDKTALQKAIADATALDTAPYTDESVAAMNEALTAAEAVQANPDATQAEVDAAAKALRDAINALQEKPADTVDKTALAAAIARAEAVDPEQYTADSVNKMNQALNNAKVVMNADSIPQEGVDSTAKALNDAIDALEPKPVSGTDKSALQAAVTKAEAIDRTQYTDESLTALDQQLTNAKSVLENADATQAMINLAERRLTNAYNALKPKEAPVTPEKCDGGANCPSKHFVDVKYPSWYHDAVDYAITHNLFNGTSATKFEPNTAMTRGMLVTVLHRMEGTPAPKSAPQFVDLKKNYYKNAVAWAAENGIVNGKDATHFAPDTNVTREEAMAILMRYADYKGYDTSARADLSAYSDANQVHKYAQNAMQWSVAVGLIQGKTATTLVPRGNATRAEVATILMRFQLNIAK